MTEEDKLLELAEKATPGRWVATDNADVVGFLGSGAVIDIAHVNPFEEMLHAQAYANAAFIAACSPETIKALVEGKRAAEARVAELEAAILRAYDKADLFCDLHYEEAHQASFDRDKDAERKSIGTYHQINQVIDAMQPELATVLKSRRAALTKKVGDTLWLREYRPGFGEGVYTGRELRRRVTYILHGGEFGIAAGHVVMGLATLPEPPSPAKQAPEAPPFTAERSSPHEQNTPSTPPDTPEGVSEAEAAMKEIFAKHGPALREALRPFQTLPAIGDEVVEAIRQMILVEEAEQTRLRSMPSAYSWNKVAVVDGKLDVLRKLSALHQAGKLPAETDMALVAAYGPNGEKLGDHVMSTADFRRAASIFTQGEQS